MKTIICVILATLLAGCAGHQFNREAFEAGFMARAGGPVRQNQSSLSAQQYKHKEVQQTDMTCYNQCMRAGTAYGLCEKNCSY